MDLIRDLVRDAPFGQALRFLSGNKLMQYPEELPGFKCPTCYQGSEAPSPSADSTTGADEDGRPHAADDADLEKGINNQESKAAEISRPSDVEIPGEELHVVRTESPSSDSTSTSDTSEEPSPAGRRHSIVRIDTRSALQKSVTRTELEQQFADAFKAAVQPPERIQPDKLDCGTIVVDWYTTDDPANPQNWAMNKKVFVSTIIYIYSFAFYMGSAIYAPSVEGIMHDFNVGSQVASLGLSMYVLAYGIGPLLFSPLSEIASIGRNPPYIYSFGVFVILLVPSALVNNVAGFMVLRFLTGFFGSPCLATAGASLGDMFSVVKLPYVLSLWAFSATAGPALGPLISGFSVTAMNWRWSMWELLWLAGPVWIAMFFLLPETSSSNILLRRARRLRAISGNKMLKSQGEIDQANLTFNDIAIEALWKPIQTILLDPSIAYCAAFTGLIYSIFYSFFEAFPIVYLGYYGFTLGEMGLSFLSIIIGATIGMVSYWSYVRWVLEPSIQKNGLGDPEKRLVPSLFSSFCLPIGLFIFAWTANPNIHWIGPTIGIMIFTIGIFVVIQSIFLYLPLTYPQYTASLFAGNDFVRSTLAAGTIHFSSVLFTNLGVGPGVSLLAALTCVCIVGLFVLWHFGPRLRARSRFAAK